FWGFCRFSSASFDAVFKGCTSNQFLHLPPLPLLARELGTPAATALLRGLARVPGAPAPRPLALLLLSLARPGGSACLDPTQHLQTPVPGTEPTPRSGQAGREPAGLRPCRGIVRRRRREDEDACSPAGEREAHRVLDWVPGVSVFYNLGTSVYFAFQGCEAVASTRALQAAEELGYAGLAALTGGLGGPVALGVQLGLQPGLKAGVRALVGYFTSAGEPPPVPTPVLGRCLGRLGTDRCGVTLSWGGRTSATWWQLGWACPCVPLWLCATLTACPCP
uniref:Apolipoprotein F n=1 Tax=Taeniopygia guttata TaxID=59729 RepID=A0A674GLB3_TAEGU